MYKATAIFKHAAERGIFLSETQRSMINVDHLTGRGWWHISDLPIDYQNHLKVSYKGSSLLYNLKPGISMSHIHVPAGGGGITMLSMTKCAEWQKEILICEEVEYCNNRPKNENWSNLWNKPTLKREASILKCDKCEVKCSWWETPACIYIDMFVLYLLYTGITFDSVMRLTSNAKKLLIEIIE